MLDAFRLLGRLRRRYEDNIKTGLNEKGCEDVDWINLNLQVP
jgi:hypothetical protein